MTRLEALCKAKIPGPETGIQIKKSICTICDPQTQCGLDVFVKDGVILKVEGSAEHPYNQGTLCAKGAANRQYVYHQDRIQTPLKRIGPRGSGEFEPVSWEEALNTIAEQCTAAAAASGPESVVFFGGYSKYFRPYLRRLAHSFGSPNFCTESSTCQTATAMAQRLVFGLPGRADIPRTKCLLLWSGNPYYTNHGNARVIQKALERGMKMIVVDPRETPTTARADIHLRLRPGTDGALALSMAQVIINEGLHDREWIARYTRGFEEYAEYVAAFPPEKGEELTGVPAGHIREAARMFAQTGPACIMPSSSPVVHHTNGVQNSRAIFMLIALTGNYDIQGGNFVVPPSYLYAPGGFSSRFGLFQAPRSLDEMPAPVGTDRFPIWKELIKGEAQAMHLPFQIRSQQPYPLKCLLGFGLNYRMWPDSEGFLKSWEHLDFVANVDIFMTDTCRHADIVLPACSSLEHSELRCYGMGYVQLSRPAVAPLHASRPTVDIICDLAKRLCPKDKLLTQGYEACLDWILQPSGMTVAQLDKHPGGMYVKNPLDVPERKYRQGAQTPSGKIEFISSLLESFADKPGLEALPVYRPPLSSPETAPDTAKKYPFILNTGSRLPMFLHSRLNRLSWSRSLRPQHPAADMHPDDAEALQIRSGDTIRIATPSGSILVKANLTRAAMPGVIHMYHGWPGADVNRLLQGDYLDPISGFPGFKAVLCAIEKAE